MSAISTEFSTGTAASCYWTVMFEHVFFSEYKENVSTVSSSRNQHHDQDGPHIEKINKENVIQLF